MSAVRTPSGSDPLARLSAALQAEETIRSCRNRAELSYCAVNELNAVVPFDVAALWWDAPRRPSIGAVSAVQLPDPDSAPAIWLGKLALWHLAQSQPRAFTAADLPADLAAAWPPTIAPQGFAVQLPGHRRPPGGLLMFRRTAWGPSDAVVLQHLAGALGYAAERRIGRAPALAWLRRRHWVGPALLVACLAALSFLPVRLSVLAPADVVAVQPAVVASPQTGTIREILVRPGAEVSAGTTLFRLDDTEIRGRAEVAQRALEVTRAELLAAQQRAYADERSRASVGVLVARQRVRAAEAATLADQLTRMTVVAPRPGVVTMGDPSDWIGRPVRVGERVMTVADPVDTRLQVWLPVGDAIVLGSGAPVRFFTDVDPLAPLDATLRETAYESEMSPDQVLSYRLQAGFSDPASRPRLGLRGTAKLLGRETTLFWYLMRRPIAAMRRGLGL